MAVQLNAVQLNAENVVANDLARDLVGRNQAVVKYWRRKAKRPNETEYFKGVADALVRVEKLVGDKGIKHLWIGSQHSFDKVVMQFIESLGETRSFAYELLVDGKKQVHLLTFD